MKHKQEKLKPYEQAWMQIRSHYLLSRVSEQVTLIPVGKNTPNAIILSNKNWGYITIFGNCEAHLYVNKETKLNEEEWFFIFATVIIVLGLDLYKKLQLKDLSHTNVLKEKAIFLFAINYVSEILNISDMPEQWKSIEALKDFCSFKNEISIYEQLENEPELQKLIPGLNLRGEEDVSIFFDKSRSIYGQWRKEFSHVFAENLVSQAKRTIALRSSQSYSEEENTKRNTEGYKAKSWFINHYPLLASLASQFEIVEDIKVCQRLDIKIAAVSPIEKTIFINPLAALNEQGMRFIIAHEILHIALNHASRRQGRNPLTWNLACDFVINHWLVSMNVGIPPSNIFMDKSLAGKSSEEIYIMINQDIRLKKKMGTLRDLDAGSNNSNHGCDILNEDSRYFAEFEHACKESLLRGMFLHDMVGRGDLPADLVEEIKAINQPVIPWQVELARWIAQRFPLEESKRTYARPSRRQSSTPDIPRPRYIRPQEDKNTRTFGVILDTSGSMDRTLLGKCLGAIASYSAAQEVKFIRLVFCDAQPYDEGYVPVEILSQKVKVKGRGGTVLQQAVNYLENAIDFPAKAPILILSDGFFESDLIVKRDHAFLVPNKSLLPFTPNGEVFEFK